MSNLNGEVILVPDCPKTAISLNYIGCKAPAKQGQIGLWSLDSIQANAVRFLA
jgi:hypothetical protein